MLWNLVGNEIISKECQPNVHLQAFANDIIFVISEPTGAKLKATAEAALTKFYSRYLQKNPSPSTSADYVWDNGETGRSVYNVFPKVKRTPSPWQRPEIMLVTGHGQFPTYLKRFKIRYSDSCGCGNLGNPLHYATSCLFTTSYHLTKTSVDLEALWWKRVMNNVNSRARVRKLIHFMLGKETIFFPKDDDNNQPQTQLTLGTHLLSPPIHKVPPFESQQHKDLKN
ncbi:hypothetical protein AVEN_125401-1 [Araneus ventricosus]|uniref:Reverse transcriptase domain-containing protein n=1 Tax=Araneus ventricosus TaxID=182803 RepID=A0A4Y2LVG4_ARAVE|nr:hypothetical protein AVEN_125401-1 [Araneus ventricosus]